MDERSFGERNFGQAPLGDQRRTRRLVTLVDTMCRHPGGTLPDKFNHPADLRAFYNLMNRPEVTHAVLMASHAAETQRRLADLPAGQVVLYLHDATELDFTSKTTLLDHLGQIGQGTRRGYNCHNSLAVRADTGETLGLVYQILHHHADVPEGKRPRRNAREDREAGCGCKVLPRAARCRRGWWALTCRTACRTRSSTAFRGEPAALLVLRAKENRKLETPVNGHRYLLDAVRSLPASGTCQRQVLPSSTRQGRTATLQVAFTALSLAVPRKHAGEYAKKPLSLWAVRLWEANPPAGEEPLEWILLTNVLVASRANAEDVLRVELYVSSHCRGTA